ncbi:toprim domain-containing protein [Vreelandella sp. H-I2]
MHSTIKTPDRGRAQKNTVQAHDSTPCDFAALMEPVARELLGDPNAELSKGDKLRFGTHGSMAVDIEAGRWFSHEDDTGGGVLDLLAHELSLGTRAEQLRWLESNGFKEKSDTKPKVAPRIAKSYDYTDESGELLYQAVRMEPKSFRQRRPDGDGWKWSVKGIRQVPYRLPELLAKPDAPVFVVEGEKDADRLADLGLLATCNAGGAGKWTNAHSEQLANRRVIVLPDNDTAGRDHAEKVRTSLEKVGAQVRVVALPELPEKGDVSDWLSGGGGKDALIELLKSRDYDVPSTSLAAGIDDAALAGEDDEGDKQAQSDKIVAFVRAWSDLFHDDNDVAYARHRQTGEVRSMSSRSFRNWLTAAFYEQTEKAVRDQSLREARMTLEGLAMQDHRTVNIRVGGSNGDYWLDLGRPGSNLAVHLRAGRWSIEESSLMFCRSDSAQELPEPVRNGDINLLWRIANVPDEARLLIIAWLVDCLRADTPYPILELLGEQGSGKSGTQTAIRRVIDPNGADLRGVPKSAEDLFVTGGVNHVISMENVSHLPAPLQDAMCVVATGGGFAKRKLYSDSDETVISLKRPIISNGIAAAITQQDAVSRAVTVELPILTDAQAKNNLEAEFEANRASIIGGLLDIAANALVHLPEMSLPAGERPRLVEFAYLGMAVARAMGREPEEFTKQFNTARQDGLERTLDASPVATSIREWAERHPGETEERSAKEWLRVIESYKPLGCDSWPRSAKGLGDAMRRAAPALRQLGIECKCLGKTGGTVKWRIGQRKLSNQSPECPEVLVGESAKQDIRTSRTSHRELSFDRVSGEEF